MFPVRLTINGPSISDGFGALQKAKLRRDNFLGPDTFLRSHAGRLRVRREGARAVDFQPRDRLAESARAFHGRADALHAEFSEPGGPRFHAWIDTSVRG